MRVYIIAGIALTTGLTAGFFIGSKYAEKKFDERLEKELSETREFYRRTYKAEEYETPEKAAEALGVSGDEVLENAAKAMRQYTGVDTPVVAREETQEVVTRNVFEESNPLKIDKNARPAGKPYVVDLDEYVENPNEHDQMTLTYYGGDDVLADDEDKVIDNVQALVGKENLQMFGASDPDQPHIVLVRNDKLNSDYEITYSDGKFAHEVLALQHSDESISTRRHRPQWDD